MELRQTLQDIVCNIEIDSSEFRISHSHFSPIETPAATVAQLQKMPQETQYEYINSKLLEFIYSIYFEGSRVTKESSIIQTNEQILQNIAAKEIDWEFYEQLENNNKGQGWYHPSFHILRQETNGSIIAEFDNGILQIKREHLPLALQSATVNDAISIFLPSSFIHKSRYRTTGDCFGGLPPAKTFLYTILIYFNFSPEAAVSAMNYITTKFNEIKLPFVFEVLHNPLNYRFYNSGVLKVLSEQYDSSQYQQFILPVLQKIYEENNFRDQVPIFTKVLAPGIGLAERPHLGLKFRNLLDSEGNYCEFVADALLEAHKNGDESSEARMKYIIQYFEHLGIDLERPYLNPNSEDIYTPLDCCKDVKVRCNTL
ncbi:MAG: T3SS effector HopA1 family protein [Nostocaceae cyanobacterium]|nr:T3SS effector HopA1 family protein [Nostocaceae cyanobacterium]